MSPWNSPHNNTMSWYSQWNFHFAPHLHSVILFFFNCRSKNLKSITRSVLHSYTNPVRNMGSGLSDHLDSDWSIFLDVIIKYNQSDKWLYLNVSLWGRAAFYVPIDGQSLTKVWVWVPQKSLVPSGPSAQRMLIGPVDLASQVFWPGFRLQVSAIQTPDRSLLMVFKIATEV